jgi:hypothetical protein
MYLPQEDALNNSPVYTEALESNDSDAFGCHNLP